MALATTATGHIDLLNAVSLSDLVPRLSLYFLSLAVSLCFSLYVLVWIRFRGPMELGCGFVLT